MRRTCFLVVLFDLCFHGSVTPEPAPPEGSSPRYPVDLTLGPRGRWLFTANEGRGSISMLDVESGEVAAELTLDPAGAPRALAVTQAADGSLLVAVSERFAHRVSLIAAGGGLGLRRLRKIPVGCLPEGLCFVPDAAKDAAKEPRLLVACSADGEVWDIDVRSGTVVRRLRAVEGVRKLLLDTDASGRRRLLVSGRTEVATIDLASGGVLHQRAPAGGTALNLNGLAVSGDRMFLAHQVKPTEVSIDPEMIVWGLVLSNRLTALRLLPAEGSKAKEAGRPTSPRQRRVYGVSVRGGSGGGDWVLPVDQRHRANGDLGELVVIERKSSSSPLILVPSGGTGRLLFVDLEGRWLAAPESLTTEEPWPSVALGGRPTVVRLGPEKRKAYVCCYLDDCVRVVDLKTRQLERTLRLGPAPRATPEHLGARVFYDSKRSRGGWYSCHSCHPSGGTSGHRFDTSADGDGLAKKAPSLRHAADTGPWSWLGRFDSLDEQIAASLHFTMAVNEPPSPQDVRHVAAFLRALPSSRPPRVENLGGSPARGAEAFKKADCDRCHAEPSYTSRGLKDVGVVDSFDGARRFNPPTLRGLRDQFRYLHDSRARSLWEVLTTHNKQGKHGKATKLTETELRDLVAFLKTL